MSFHSAIKDQIPSINFSGFATAVTWLIFIVIFIGIFGTAAYFFMRHKKFDRKIVIFEKVGQQYLPVGKDRGFISKFGQGGDTILFLQKRKKYLPTPSLQTGAKTYWYAIREDGEWINISMGDIDWQMKKAGAKFMDKEVRYARTQIQKGLKERYEQDSFWKQHGVIIVSVGFVVIMGVMTWLLFDKWIDLANTTNSGVKSAGDVMDRAKVILNSLDNICSGGSGLK